MKKIITCLMLVCLLLCSFVFSSCSSFFEEETLMIEDRVVSEGYEPDGSKKITIMYVDKVKPDDVFYIPQGVKGDAGPAVDIIVDYDEKGNLVLTIDDFNDQTEDPSYTVYRGTKILRISDELQIDESDPAKPQYYFSVVYDDNGEERSENVYFPMPKDGATLMVKVEDLNGDGNKWLVFSYDDGREGAPEPVLIPKGENGRSVYDIEYVIDPNDRTKYALIITYELADGTTYSERKEGIEAPGTWITSAGMPTEEYGRVGDFCWDKDNNKIYYKKNSSQWEPMFDFDVTKGEPYTVTFILNDNNSGEASFPAGFESGEILINPLSSFYQDEKAIPVPTWPGHTFLGWYATREGNNIDPRIHGQLTNLTTISCDMTVYALWD